LRAADGRDVPEAKLGPNVAYYPPGDRWGELRVVRDAEPVRQQEVTAKRDEIERRLRELIDEANRSQRAVYKLHQETEQNNIEPKDQDDQLRKLTEGHEALARKLTDLAKDADVADLKPLAEKMQAVAEQELRQAAEAFRDAAPAAGPARVPPLRRADKALADARDKLEALLQENRELAKARLDEVKLDDLAECERELAERAKEAATPEEREKLAQQQKQLAEELNKLTEESDALRNELKAAQADDAHRLAEDARKLAQAQRDLDNRLRDAERQRNAAKLADLARKQDELAKEADRLAKSTKAQAQTAQAQPLQPEAAAKAAQSLRQGDADE